MDFRRGEGEAGIGLMMNNGHADGAVGMVFAVIVVMESFTQKGEEKEANEDE